MFRVLFNLLAAGLILAPPASSAGMADDVARAEVLSGWRTDDGSHMAAIRITLAPGWKTYWRAPGDAGIPPLFDWSGSENIAGLTIHWPLPEVFKQNGMRSVGYSDVVVIPIEFAPVTQGQDMRIAGRLDIGVCLDVCVPVSLPLAGLLASPGAADPAISVALDSLPVSAAAAGVTNVTCAVDPIADGIRLTARIDMPRLEGREIAVMEMTDPAIWVSEAEMSREGGTLIATAEMVPPTGQPFLVNRSEVRITVLAGNRGVDIRGCGAS